MFHCISRKWQSPSRLHPGAYQMHCRNHSRRSWKTYRSKNICTTGNQLDIWVVQQLYFGVKRIGTIHLCWDPARLKQILIRSVHRGPTVSDIFLKQSNVGYLTLIGADWGYHNLKLCKKLSGPTTFACQFGRCRCTSLPIGMVPVGNMFQCKIDEIFQNLPNVFGIVDDILAVGDDDDRRDNDRTLRWVMQICHKENLKLIKNNMPFQLHEGTILWWDHIKTWCAAEPS